MEWNARSASPSPGYGPKGGNQGGTQQSLNAEQSRWTGKNPKSKGNTIWERKDATSPNPKQTWAKEVEQCGNKQSTTMKAPEQKGSTTRTKEPSNWEKFDVTKLADFGFKLHYIQPEKQGEQLIGFIDYMDIATEIEYWRSSVVCYVLGAPPPFCVIDSFIRRIWAKHGVSKVVMMKNGVILVRLVDEGGQRKVLNGGMYRFDNKALIVKAWDPDMDFSKEELLTVPIWIKLPDLNIKYWGMRSLSKLGSLVGRPVMVDGNTEKKIGLRFARLLVEVQIGNELPDSIRFRNEKGVLVEQEVLYDWNPSIYAYCKEQSNEQDKEKNKEQPGVVLLP